MDTLNIGLATGNEAVPTERVQRNIETIFWCVFVNCFSNLGTIPHGLFRYAAHIDTSTTNIFGFNNSNVFTMFSCTVGRRDTAASTANTYIIKMSHSRCLFIHRAINNKFIVTRNVRKAHSVHHQQTAIVDKRLQDADAKNNKSSAYHYELDFNLIKG